MKKRLGLIIAIILIVVGCLGYFGYRYMTPKKVLVRTLHSYKESLFKENKNQENIKKILSKDYKELDVNGKMTYSSQNIGFNAKYNQDDKNKISQIKYDLDIDKTKISGDLVSTNKKLYITIKDVFKKYYYMDMDEMGSLFNGDYIDILKLEDDVDVEKLVDLLIDSIDENLSNSSFISSKETITLNDKKINTTKYTITYNKKLRDNIVKTFLDKVKKNNDASSSLSKLLKVEEKELDKTIDEYVDSLKDGDDFSVKLNIYTKLNKTYLIELEDDGTKLGISKDKDIYNFSLKEDEVSITGKLICSNNYKIKIEAKMDSEYYTMELNSVTDITKSNSKEVTMNNTTSMSMKIDGSKTNEAVKFDVDATLKEGKEINSDIIKNADKFDNITESEMEAFEKLFTGNSLLREQLRESS